MVRKSEIINKIRKNQNFHIVSIVTASAPLPPAHNYLQLIQLTINYKSIIHGISKQKKMNETLPKGVITFKVKGRNYLQNK